MLDAGPLFSNRVLCFQTNSRSCQGEKLTIVLSCIIQLTVVCNELFKFFRHIDQWNLTFFWLMMVHFGPLILEFFIHENIKKIVKTLCTLNYFIIFSLLFRMPTHLGDTTHYHSVTNYAIIIY